MIKHKNLIEALEGARKETEKGIRFINGDKDSTFVTYEELYQNSLIILGYLQSIGIEHGSELVFQIQDNDHTIYMFWACLLGGFIPVPVAVGNNDEHRLKLFKIWSYLNNPYLVIDAKSLSALTVYGKENNLESQMETMKNKTIYIESVFNKNSIIVTSNQGVIHMPEPGSIAFIQFSSGSTGDPKGVILTHENLIANIMGIVIATETTSDDSFLSWMPLTHDMGMIGFHLVPLALHINQYLIPTKLFVRHPTLWLKAVNEFRATLISSPNFGYSYLLSHFSQEIAKDWDLSCVRLLVNGAEPISYELCNQFLDEMLKYGLKRTSMFTVYGMAEACVGVAMPHLGHEFKTVMVDRNHLGIGERIIEMSAEDANVVGFVEEGYAIDYCSLRICDEKDNVVEDRVVGQIQIKGENVTRGYYNNPAATEKIITKDGWLRTGDLAFLRDGSLVVTGRLKDIIFVNGQNFYPHDIERVLEEIEGLETGRVVAAGAFNNETKEEEIIIFVLYKKKLEDFLPLASRIKLLLKEKIGLFIRHVVPIKKVPKTTSGKVQRYKLADMYQGGSFSEELSKIEELKAEIAATENNALTYSDTEELVIKLCRDTFKNNNIDINGSFVELGINSLKLTSLASAIHEHLNVEIPLKDMFQISTVRELAEYISDYHEQSIYSSIEAVAGNPEHPQGCFEASSAQKRLYVIDQIDTDTIGPNTGYNMPEALLIEGELDIAAMEQAFRTLIKRHESLRTSFTTIDGEPIQRIHDNVDFKISCFKTTEDKVNDIMRDFIRPFTMDVPPLFRVALIEIAANKYVLVLDMHHIISDGWSVMVLIKELLLLLEGESLPDLEIQYKDFAVWQNKLFKSDEMQKKEEYWLKRFEVKDGGKLPVLNIPTDFPRPSNKSYEGDRLVITTGRELIDALNKVAEITSSTLHMVMLAAYTILLSKYSGQEDIIVGSPIAGRPHKDLQDIIGMFINMLANRNTPRRDMTFKDFLAEVKENCLNTYQNQEYQFDELVSKLKVKRDMSRNPLFDYVFAVQNLDIPDMQNSKISVRPYDFAYNISRFDMFLSVMEMGDSVRFLLEYSTALFKKTTAERIIKHYMEILEQIKDNVNIRLEDIVLSHNLSTAKSNILKSDDDFDF